MPIDEAPFLILVSCVLFYSLVQVGLLWGIWRLENGKTNQTPFVSIIVAARNEEATIEALLSQLTSQSYSNLEIIIVNDRSTDNTGALVSSFQSKHPNLKRIDISSLPPDMPGKKNALSEGIRASKGEILCFTDADCLPTKNWVAELVRSFEPSVGLVAGYSPYTEPAGSESPLLNRLLHRFIAYEEFKGAAWASGSIGVGLAWLCTGRNLAYRRRVFDEVGGFQKIKKSVSGDDDLFLQLVRRETQWRIRFVTSPESFVQTSPPLCFRAFVEQRKRHFSAAKFFTIPMKMFFFLFHGANLILLSGFLWFVIHPGSFLIGGVTFAFKILADWALYRRATRIFPPVSAGAGLVHMEILYILYNTFIGPLGFIASFEWKPSQTH